MSASSTLNWRRTAEVGAPPVVFGVLLLVVWQAFVAVFDIKRYILPKPTEILSAVQDDFTLIRKAMVVTGTNSLIGLVVGAAFGALLALLTSRWKIVSDVVAPLEVAARTVPIVVVVAVLQGMFPSDTETPRRFMVTIAVFFIVYVNVTRGLRQSDPTKVELMRSYAASPREIVRKVRIPNALPYFFTAVRISAPVAVVTAFVAEYFGGRQNGLGYRISSAFGSSREPEGWAAVLGACALGVMFFIAGSLLEYVALPWQRRRAAR
jgi:NitT/TauT family transport system permease protein